MSTLVFRFSLLRLKAGFVTVLFGVLGACVLGGAFLFPQHVHAEYIETFTSDITVNSDASISVSEDIVYVFDEERHGIYRCIPTIHFEKASSLLKERYIDIAFTEVTMDGKEVPFIHSERGEDECVKIGDPDATIIGPHTYQIAYHVYGVISYQPSGGADLYWNVTGNGWEVPMRTVVARVTSPEGILMRERACYRGREGKTDSCDSMSEGEGTYIYTDGALGPNEGVTIAQAVNRSHMAKDIRERYKSALLWGIGIILALVSLVYGIYRYKTRFKTGKTIIPQYEPYPGVKPMYAGLLMDGRLDPRDITACIVYLAEQGFIKIKKTEKKVLFLFEVDDYEMTLLKDMSEITNEFERDVMDLVFDIDAKAGTARTLSDLKGAYSEARRNTVLLMNLKTQMQKDLRQQGYFMGFDFTKISLGKAMIGIFIGLAFFNFFVAPLESGVPVALVVGVFILMIILSGGRRTKKGYEALDHLKGFKDFLRVTERERFIFHNAPTKSPEQFMEFLPYAIAFGVEKQWAKTFEGITIPTPSWYDGGGVSTFNAVSLSQSLGGFSTAFAASSGTSASSGGGSSGGGSGGGGGGSW